MRSVIFHPKAQQAIRRFSKDVRVRVGKGLFRLQMGELIGMPDSRPMPGVAAGVSELRVGAADGSFRVFYYTLHREAFSFFTPSSRRHNAPRLWKSSGPRNV